MKPSLADSAPDSQRSIAYADRHGRVTEIHGPLSHWIEIGETLTESNPALIGQEDALAALIASPEDNLTLTDISFSGLDQDAFYTITVEWDRERQRFALSTSTAEDTFSQLANAIRTQRAARYEAQQLELEREHFRTIYEESPQLAICLDRSGAVVAASQQLRDRFLYEGGDEATHLLSVLTNHRVWDSLWQGAEPIGIPIRARDASGRGCELDMSAIAAQHPNQLREEVYFTFVDVTERNTSRLALMERRDDLESLSKRLQDSNKKLDQFASVAAHDLLAPLRRIAAFADMLNDELDDHGNDSVAYAVDAIRRSASTGQRLVEDILQLSRIASMDSRLEPIRIVGLFNEVASEYDYKLNEIGGLVEWSGIDLAISGDTRLAKLIIRNLLSNAIKYRHSDRALRIQLRQITNGTPHARIEIIDNGIGMESQLAQQAFGAFVRLGEKNDIPGHGLGLAIVDEAAKTMGWHVFAHSEPNQGTRMVLTAPLADPKDAIEQNGLGLSAAPRPAP
ncbi:MAG: ATP-binding protein [Pseudomonadota bacterium]